MTNVEFKRHHFVTDLYNPKHFLNYFDIVEFYDVKTFMMAMEQDYYAIWGDLRIHVRSEFEAIKKLIQQSVIADKCRLELILHDDELLREYKGFEDKRFMTVVSKEFEFLEYMSLDYFKTYRSLNPISIAYEITFQNINTVFDEIIDQYQRNNCRFFYLTFDFESFEEAKLSDVHRIFFRINRFLIWVRSARNKKHKQDNPRRLEYYGNGRIFRKKIFVDLNLQLWFNEKHFREKRIPPLFTLKQEENGETIPFKTLNMIRQYLDLTKDSLVMHDKSFTLFIDPYQNLLTQGIINEVPVIAELINRWFKIVRN